VERPQTHNLNDAAGVLRRRPFAAVAAEQLRRRWKKVLKIGKRLDTLDPQHRHKLRIQAKKLRYASEFFAPAFQHQKSTLRRKDFVESLRQLQDALGELNDVVVNQKLLKPLCGGENAPGTKQHGGRIRKTLVGSPVGPREGADCALAQASGASLYRLIPPSAEMGRAAVSLFFSYDAG
jgi:CHAD domain-containing protein